MKFGVSVLLTIIASFAAGLYLPFWSVALVSFGIAVLKNKKRVLAWLKVFVSFLIWWGLLAFWKDAKNDSILSPRTASFFPLGVSSGLLIQSEEHTSELNSHV